MKRITFIVAFLFSFVVNAQESYPAKHPELLKDKKVKIISTSFADTYGYSGFYSDAAMRKTYMPSELRKNNTVKEALTGKTFTVTNVEPERMVAGWRVSLKGDGDTVVYFKYDTTNESNFPFEVIGGLTLPDGFYCDLIKQTKEDDWDNYDVMVGEGVILKKSVSAKESFYIVTISDFFPKNSAPLKSITLILTEGKTITLPTNTPVVPTTTRDGSFRFAGIVVPGPKDIALLKTHKLTAVKFGEQTGPKKVGEKLRGVINCLEK